ncbi:MAG: DUF1292 domain-containing protein, partial [Sporomusaceae bacterium]|nr:DUF1292 domain-containing protein [Sporomusaceae bacterium]
MSDKEREELEFDEMDDEPVVVMTDEEGNEYYYREELIITVGDKRYAILAPLEDEELECGDCGCGDEDCRCADDFDDLDVFIAR